LPDPAPLAIAGAWVAFALLGCLAAYVFGRGLGGPWLGLLCSAFLAVAPSYSTFAGRISADLPAAALLLVAVALAFHRGERTNGLWRWTAPHPAWKPGASVSVVMASGGYPGSFETGKKITGLAEAGALPDVAVFHAGTKREGDSIVTSGGRVLGVTAAADSLPHAIQKAYEATRKIHFEGAQCRTDIGAKGDLRARVATEAPRG